MSIPQNALGDTYMYVQQAGTAILVHHCTSRYVDTAAPLAKARGISVPAWESLYLSSGDWEEGENLKADVVGSSSPCAATVKSLSPAMLP